MSHYGYPDRGTPYNNPAPMPKHIPHVDEIGATSAPLKSASFFIGEKCKEFNGLSPVQFQPVEAAWSVLVTRLKAGLKHRKGCL
jgi:hypothetical protein